MEFEKFRALLGVPVYEDEDVLIYHGDSLQILKSIPSESVPLTVTSPPYNIGKSYESIMPIDKYVDWTANWTSEIFRISEPTGAFWLNLGYTSLNARAKAIPLPYLIWDRVPFYLVQEIVWNYGAGVAGRLFFSPRNEKWLWYVKNPEDYVFNLDDIRDPNVKYPNQKKNGKLKCNPNGKNPSDVWQIPKVTSGTNRSSKERTPHPAQFPIQLVSRIILASSRKGQAILDPFVGSGSLIEAAIQNGRKAIGIEIDRSYIEIAVDRVKSVRRHQRESTRQSTLLLGNALNT